MASETGRLRGFGPSSHLQPSRVHLGQRQPACFGTLSAVLGMRGQASSRDGGRKASISNFNPTEALGGIAFLAIMGLSAYGEWRVAQWLLNTVFGV